MSNTVPPAHAELHLAPAAVRHLLYGAILDELAAVQGGAADDPSLVLYSNWGPPARRLPDAIACVDVRDLVFQRDPFPGFWAAFEAELSEVAAARAARPPLLLAAAELSSVPLGSDDWNREQVFSCGKYLGETMTYDASIYCGGTTMGTPAGLAAYIGRGMMPALLACDDVSGSGIDQGIHNILLQPHTPEQLAFWRARAAAGGPFADDGPTRHAAPLPERPAALLDAVEGLRASGVLMRAARTEDGLICTLALVVRMGSLEVDGEGIVMAAGADGVESQPCAIVHQFDRDADTEAHYRAMYGRGGVRSLSAG